MPFHDKASDWLKEQLAKARASHPVARRSLPPTGSQAPSQVAEAFRRRTGIDPAPPRRLPTPISLRRTPVAPSLPTPVEPPSPVSNNWLEQFAIARDRQREKDTQQLAEFKAIDWRGALARSTPAQPPAPPPVPYQVRDITPYIAPATSRLTSGLSGQISAARRDDLQPIYTAEDQYQGSSVSRNVGEWIQRQSAISDYIQQEGTTEERLKDLGPLAIRRGAIKQAESFRSLQDRLNEVDARARQSMEMEEEKRDYKFGVGGLHHKLKYMMGTGEVTPEDPGHGALWEAFETFAWVPAWEETGMRQVGRVAHMLDEYFPGNQKDLEEAIAKANLSEEEADRVRNQYRRWGNWDQDTIGPAPQGRGATFDDIRNWVRDGEFEKASIEGKLRGKEEFEALPWHWQILGAVGPGLLAGGGSGATVAGNRFLNLARKSIAIGFLDPPYWVSIGARAMRRNIAMNNLGKHLFQHVKAQPGWLRQVQQVLGPKATATFRRIFGISDVSDIPAKAAAGRKAGKQVTQTVKKLTREEENLELARLSREALKGGADLTAEATVTGRARQIIAKTPILGRIIAPTAQTSAAMVLQGSLGLMENILNMAAGTGAAPKLKVIQAISDLDGPVKAASKRAQRYLDDLGLFDRPAPPELVKRVWGIDKQSTVTTLDSPAGHILRALWQETFTSKGAQRKFLKLAAKAKEGDKTAQADLIALVSEGAMRTVGATAAELPKAGLHAATKFSLPFQAVDKGYKWMREGAGQWQGWYMRNFHMGPVTGVAVRNVQTDLTTMTLGHALMFNARQFFNKWNGTVEAVQRGVGAKGKVKLQTRDLETILDPTDHWFKRNIWQVGLRLLSKSEDILSKVAWTKGARSAWRSLWQQGPVADDIVREHGAALSREHHTFIVDELRQAVSVEDVRAAISKVRVALGKGFANREHIPRAVGDEAELHDVLEVIEGLLSSHKDDVTPERLLAAIDDEVDKIWDDAFLEERIQKTFIPEGPEARGLRAVEDMVEDLVRKAEMPGLGKRWQNSAKHAAKEEGLLKEKLHKWRQVVHVARARAQYAISKVKDPKEQQRLQALFDEATAEQTRLGEVTASATEEFRDLVRGLQASSRKWKKAMEVTNRQWDDWQETTVFNYEDLIIAAEDIAGKVTEDIPDVIASRLRVPRIVPETAEEIGELAARRAVRERRNELSALKRLWQVEETGPVRNLLNPKVGERVSTRKGDGVVIRVLSDAKNGAARRVVRLDNGDVHTAQGIMIKKPKAAKGTALGDTQIAAKQVELDAAEDTLTKIRNHRMALDGDDVEKVRNRKGTARAAEAISGGEMPGDYDMAVASVRSSILKRWGKAVSEIWDETEEQVDDDVLAALANIEREGVSRLSKARGLIERYGNEFRDYNLHNYSKRFNIDSFMGLPFGYPFWYTRTYAKWFGKAVSDPYSLSAMYRHNDISDRMNEGEDLPPWLQKAVLWTKPFGFAALAGKTFAIPILKNLHAVQSMIEPQFRDTDRMRNRFGSSYEAIYGTGLGPHVMIPTALMAYYTLASAFATGKQKEEYFKQAMSYGGYMGSLNRQVPSAVAALSEHTALDFPGGLGVEPLAAVANAWFGPGKGVTAGKVLMLGAGWAYIKLMYTKTPSGGYIFTGTKYDSARTVKELAKMAYEEQPDGSIGVILSDGTRVTVELATDATMIAHDPQAYLEHDEQGPAWRAWREANQRSRLEKSLPSLISYLGGPGFAMRGEEEIALENTYKRALELAKAKDDPNVDADDLAMMWTEFSAEDPHWDIVSMAKQHGSERFRNYTWSVLSRIGRGQHTRDIYESMGMPYELIEAWYDTKGELPSGSDKAIFEEKIVVIGSLIASPDLATAVEWKEAAQATSKIYRRLEDRYPGSEEIMDAYYSLDYGSEEAKAMLRKYPVIQARIDAKHAMLLSDEFKSAAAPYYVTQTKAEQYLLMVHDIPFDAKYPGVSEAYQRDYLPRRKNMTTAERDAYLRYYEGMWDYDKSYWEWTKGKDAAVAAIADSIRTPLLPELREDAPEGVYSQQLQAAVKELGPILEGTITSGDSVDVVLTNLAQTDQIAQSYFDDNRDEYLFKTFEPIALDMNSLEWAEYRDEPLLARWPVDRKGHMGLVAYVQQQGGTGLRDAMMKETMGGVSKQDQAWKVIGTVLDMDPAQLRNLAQVYPELNDIEMVFYSAYATGYPTMDALFGAMGFRAEIGIDGKARLAKSSKLEGKTREEILRTGSITGSLVTDENDKYISDGDIWEYIRRLSDAELGEGVYLKGEEYRMMMTIGEYDKGLAILDADPRIEAYAELAKEIWARFNAAKAGPGSKKFAQFFQDLASGKRTDNISSFLDTVMAQAKTSTWTRSSAAKAKQASEAKSKGYAKRQKSAIYDFSVDVPVIHDVGPDWLAARQQAMAPARQPAPAQPQVDITPWTNLVSSLQTSNPALLNQIRDYFDLSLYARQSHVKRNPDLARWLATTPAAELAKLERAFYAWSQQAGRLSSRQESRVSRTRPALANVLRVYKQRSTRAGI